MKHDERRHHSPIAAELTVEEVAKAEKFWVHSAQTDAFENERRELEISQSIQVRQTTPMKQRGKTGKGSRLQGLSPFIDEDQLIRVGGRIGHADLPYDTRHPYVLPKRHAVSALIVRDTHEKFDHEIGIEHNLAELRQKFWIISGREEIKRGIRGCPECKRRRERTGTQIMAPKRREQLKPSYRAFSHCGVDFAGPVETRQGRGRVKAKRYICLFTCFQTRAVHLEMAYGLDTDSFLCAFDRFIARRGVPEGMWSDNGRNFVSAEKELKKTSDTLDRNKVQKEGVARGIRWHFNPPAAPHFGGAYEALIKSVKRAMYSTLRNTSITDEELQSALCRAEALLNSRPLTPLSTDPSDELPLTPAHFLVGHIRTEVDVSLDGARGHLKRWRLVQQMTAVFWKRWQREYVLSLQARTKWRSPQKDLAEGDVVMMADSSVSRGQWPLARVVKVHRGTDGHVRVVDVKCKGKVYTRPVVRLVHLESAPKQD